MQKSIEYVFKINPGDIGFHNDAKMRHLFHLENLRSDQITNVHKPWRRDELTSDYIPEWERFCKITKVLFFIDLEWLIPFLRNTYYFIEHKIHFNASIFKLLGIAARRFHERSNKNEEMIIPASFLHCHEDIDEENEAHKNTSTWLRQKGDTIPLDDSMTPVYACNDMIFWTLWRSERRHLFRHSLYRPFQIMTAEYLASTRLLRDRRGRLMKPFARLVSSFVTRVHPLYPYKQDNKDKYCYFRIPPSIRMWKMEENAHVHRQQISYLKREVEIVDLQLKDMKERKEMLEKLVKEGELTLSNSIVENEHSDVSSLLVDQCRALPLTMAPLDLWEYDPKKQRRFTVDDFVYERSAGERKDPWKIIEEKQTRIDGWLKYARSIKITRSPHAINVRRARSLSSSSSSSDEESFEVHQFMTPPGDDVHNETLEDHDNAYRECILADQEDGASEDYEELPNLEVPTNKKDDDNDNDNDIALGGDDDFMQIDKD